jgi:hypothetical protein
MNPAIFINATIIGIITLIIGNIIFNLTINKHNKLNNENTPFGQHIAFFATGFFLHIIVELIGFNQSLCNKL